MKVKLDKISEKEKMITLDTLYTAASTVKGRGAVKSFLKDLLTPSERIMLGRRIIIARKLLAGNTHDDIVQGMKVGADTVQKIQRWLNDQLPDYENAIAGLEREFDKRQVQKLRPGNILFGLKRKYPLHFLLFPTPKPKRNK